jgi:hypothetical protein
MLIKQKIINYCRSVRLAYQPPANSIFLSEQTTHQQSGSRTFLSEQISTSDQTKEQAIARVHSIY